MPLLTINRDLPPSQLRLFGLALLVVASLLCWKLGGFADRQTALLWLGPVAAVVLPGFLALRWMRLLYLGVSWVTFPIGFVVSYVILGAAFYGVISVAGLIMRALGRDPLSRRWNKKAPTYWQKRVGSRPLKSYFEQF